MDRVCLLDVADEIWRAVEHKGRKRICFIGLH